VLPLRLVAVALWRLSVITPFFLGEPFVVERGKREGLAKPIDIVRRVTLDAGLQDGLPGCGAESLGWIDAGNSGKLVIMYHMILWTSVTGGCIENKANGRGMLQTVSQKLTATGPWLPFWNLVSILEPGVETIYGATKGTQTSKMVVADKEGTCVEFLRGKASVRTKQMVP
jgi:hypothetical protein